MTDREEREKVIEILQKEKKTALHDNRWAFDYAIASIKTDLRYDLLYEETSGQADKPTTKKDCNTCTHGNETDGSNCYECVKDMCNNYEPTTKNDVPDINVGKIESTTKDYLGVDYLGVDCISRSDVLKLMQDNWHTHNGDWAMQESMDDIRALPSVTPIRPKGHWIVAKGNYLGRRNACCSNCKDFYTNDWNVMDYCPHCGAKMVESQESEEI